MIPPLPREMLTPETILIDYVINALAIAAFALFMYFSHRLIKSFVLPTWLKVVGYIYFLLLNSLLVFIANGIIGNFFSIGYFY